MKATLCKKEYNGSESKAKIDGNELTCLLESFNEQNSIKFGQNNLELDIELLHQVDKTI